MSVTLPPHLAPARTGVWRAWWEGAARGELRLPRCRTCASYQWPPRRHCATCESTAIDWVAASGRGIVHTFTVVRQAHEPWFSARVPYVVAMIELAEGPRLMSNVVECAIEAVHIGMRVTVAFVDCGDGLVLPVFTANAG